MYPHRFERVRSPGNKAPATALMSQSKPTPELSDQQRRPEGTPYVTALSGSLRGRLPKAATPESTGAGREDQGHFG